MRINESDIPCFPCSHHRRPNRLFFLFGLCHTPSPSDCRRMHVYETFSHYRMWHSRYLDVCMYARMYGCISINHKYPCVNSIYLCKYIYIYRYIYMCVCVYLYMYICIYIDTHDTYTFTQNMQASKYFCVVYSLLLACLPACEARRVDACLPPAPTCVFAYWGIRCV